MSTTQAPTTEFKTLSLKEAAEFDHKNGLRDKLTGWGRISLDRRERGISRKARREKK